MFTDVTFIANHRIYIVVWENIRLPIIFEIPAFFKKSNQHVMKNQIGITICELD